jgi:hypothetical protein
MATPTPGAIVGPAGRPNVAPIVVRIVRIVPPIVAPIDPPVTAKEAGCVEH